MCGKKIVVWCLYDDGYSCWGNGAKQLTQDLDIYCFGIADFKYWDDKKVKIDLSVLNDNLINELIKYPKPDIIVASPPCESWSNAARQQLYKAGSVELNNKEYFKQFGENFNFEKRQKIRLMGEATQMAVVKIIEYFKPICWVIENPQSAKSWLYQEQFLFFNGHKNLAYYYNYDSNFSKKPTIFKSNILFDLQHKNIKTNITLNNKKTYDIRSKIPIALTKEILNKLVNIVERYYLGL